MSLEAATARLPVSRRSRLGPPLWVATALVLQTTAVPGFCPPAWRPQLVLLTVALMGLAGGSAMGWCCGLWAGFLELAVTGLTPGAFFLSRALAGVVGGLCGRHLARDHWLAPLLVGALGTLTAEAAYGLMVPGAPLPFWAQACLQEAAVNAFLGFLLFPPLRRVVEGRAGA